MRTKLCLGLSLLRTSKDLKKAIKAGANPSARDHEGKTPLDLAEMLR